VWQTGSYSLEKFALEFVQNSLKWCLEFAKFHAQNFQFFLAQNSDNATDILLFVRRYV